jgi:hypothetical protein
VAILKKTTAFDFNMSISGPIKKNNKKKKKKKREGFYLEREGETKL